MKVITKLKLDEKTQEWNDNHPEHRELSRKLLAELSGSSYKTICNLNSEVGGNLNAVYKMCQILNCTFEELIETIEE